MIEDIQAQTMQLEQRLEAKQDAAVEGARMEAMAMAQVLACSSRLLADGGDGDGAGRREPHVPRVGAGGDPAGAVGAGARGADAGAILSPAVLDAACLLACLLLSFE